MRSLPQREAEYRAREARARHAAFHAEIKAASLGTRTTILLLAAADAELAKPSVIEYRIKLVQLVGVEVRRRYPERRQEEWEVITDTPHQAILDAARKAEREARDLVLLRRPELAQKIDAFRCRRLERGVTDVHLHIRGRLVESMSEGWQPNPERYRREVLEGALEHRTEAA